MIALPNGPLQRVLLFAAISSVALFAFVAVHSAGPSRFLYNEYDDDMNCTRSRLTNTRLSRLRLRVQPLSLTDSIRELYAPLRLPIDATSYTVLDGTEYTLPGEPIWHKPFGKEICIVDVDTRIPTGINQVFNKSRLDWEKLGDEKFMDAGLGRVSAGVLNHYLYAQIHGYDYKFVQAAPKPDRGNTWVKVDAIAELLNSYRFVIFLDADAVWEHMEVPAEWLFNRWNITERTSIAMPMDVKREDCVTCDSRKRLMQNTGLIVAQQSERTQEMFAAWASCPGDERYPGCSTWRHKWAHEQRAFAEYVRYEFDRPDDVKEISCYDANGYPERGRYVLSQCDGTFVRHYWVRKHFAKGAIGNAVLQSIMGRLQTQLLEQQEGILVNKTLGPA